MDESFDVSGVKTGNIVKGKVILVGERDVFVECGFKSEVSVPLVEFSAIPSVGDEVNIVVIGESPQGLIGSRLKAERKEKINDLNSKFANGGSTTGKIVKVLYVSENVKDSNIKTLKGFLVDLGTGLKGFLPASQVEIGKLAYDPSYYLGKEFQFKVINKKEGQFVVSRKALLQEELNRSRELFLGKVKVGDEVKGIVKKITDKYIVLDVEGVNALLLISDFSWNMVSNISSVVNIGDTMVVKVLNVIKDKNYIRVGRKQLDRDPFEEFKNSHKVNDVVSGSVISVKDKYVIVELTPGVKGIILLQDISWGKRIKSMREEFSIGDLIKGKIISDIDEEKRLIRLSIKDLQPDPWSDIETKYKKGQIVRGRVNTVTDFAIFVGISEGIDGILRKEEIHWENENVNLRRLYSKGQMVEAIITKVDKAKRLLILSSKRLTDNPWERFKKINSVGSEVDAIVEEVRDDRVVVDLGNDLKGYIPSGHFSIERNVDVKEKFKPGQNVKALVLKVVVPEKLIELSVKDYEKKLIEEAKKDFVIKDPDEVRKGTLADLLRIKGVDVKVSSKESIDKNKTLKQSKKDIKRKSE